MTSEATDTLLGGVRVLDLATSRAEMTGRVLADMGAEVIKVEPPWGTPSRKLPPFSDEDPERSLYWAAMGFGKRSVVIDLDDEDGRADFRALLATADVLIESFDPGVMAAWGLGYDDVQDELPDLIYVSVTPYGQDGPKSDRPATDLTIESAGGLVGLQGDGDRPPVPLGLPQASIHAGVQAAADTSIALRERELSGLGQHLDVSMQAAVVWTLMHATGFPPNTGGDPPGTCAQRNVGGDNMGGAVMGVHPCLDGYIVFSIVPGGLGLRHSTLVLKWIEEEGELTGELEGADIDEWAANIARLVTEDPAEVGRQVVIASENMHRFVAKKTMAECFERAVRDSFMMAPLYTMEDIAKDKHLAARNFWVDIDGHRYPGPFAKLSKTPLQLVRPAPTLGQDQALLAEVGRAPQRAARAPISSNGVRGEDGGALHGVKVADFAWVGVGPLISKSMADHGATVVHIESATRPDVLRLAPPFKDNEPGMDRAQFMANFNSSKIGVALRLDTEQGRDYARQLIDWADVVVESFTPGTMKQFGFDYATLSQERPELIMLSTCLRGSDRSGVELSRLWPAGRLSVGSAPDHGLARPSALGHLGRVHGLHQSALRFGRVGGGDSSSRFDRAGSVHRSGPERGGHSLRRAAAARLPGERTHRASGGSRLDVRRSERRLPRPGRRALCGDCHRDCGAMARAARHAGAGGLVGRRVRRTLRADRREGRDRVGRRRVVRLANAR